MLIELVKNAIPVFKAQVFVETGRINYTRLRLVKGKGDQEEMRK